MNILIVEDHKIIDFDGSYDAYKNQHKQNKSNIEKIESIKKSIKDYENRDYKTMTDADYEHYESLSQALESMGQIN